MVIYTVDTSGFGTLNCRHKWALLFKVLTEVGIVIQIVEKSGFGN